VVVHAHDRQAAGGSAVLREEDQVRAIGVAGGGNEEPLHSLGARLLSDGARLDQRGVRASCDEILQGDCEQPARPRARQVEYLGEVDFDRHQKARVEARYVVFEAELQVLIHSE
jgi:hypothetical protein